MLSFIPSMDAPIPEPSFGSTYQCGYNETEINDKNTEYCVSDKFFLSSIWKRAEEKTKNFINGKIIYCFIWYRNMYFIHLVDEYNFF